MNWPTSLRFSKSRRALNIAFDDGTKAVIPYQLLREESPSAENKGHGNGPPPPRAPIPADIGVVRADLTGRYAVRIEFTDGHKTGLYTWDLLKKLGEKAQIGEK
jgi:DUF971 family protein